MEWGGNLCLHIHLINQSQCSLYMCICIYFYLLKCFRLLGTEKAFILLHNKTQSGVPPGLDSFVTQLCHQEHSFFPSFFCVFLDMQTMYLHWLLQDCKVIIIGTGVSSKTSPDFQRQRTPYLLPVKGNLSRPLSQTSSLINKDCIKQPSQSEKDYSDQFKGFRSIPNFLRRNINPTIFWISEQESLG